ncbi:J domain-containing protein [Bowmanella sp. Y26]|uniref:DNA-J related domain-containing protein n=1 Tax=Bowmanella yangjiangensis TaxID=2811230 RepID=UPI001BDC118A|nr:DNA-J related domain-containing protein [Bowmanella yangjiangensis]MBT1063071.1 J domain-containing protein [Bowmanella yangjiangensis]
MSQPADFAGLLHQLLQQAPEGLSEYDLISLLKSAPHCIFASELTLSDPLVMFQTHFVLFHQLYQLRNHLRLRQQNELLISAMRIQLQPYQPGNADITAHDGLAAYYLNWDNFRQTSEADVTSLLDDFWRRMSGVLSPDERRAALAILELDDSADQAAIRRQYRRLMHLHHPDKGGDHAYCQQLSDAYRKLT